MELELQEDDEQNKGESSAFLSGTEPGVKRSILYRKRKTWFLLLIIFLGLLVVVLSKSSMESRSTATTSITKVTGLYGTGAWREGEAPEIAAKVPSYERHNNLLRAISLHKKQAELHGHKQVVQTVQLFGGRINNAYTKIGNLLEQNLIEMSLGSKGSKWLLCVS